MYSYKYPRMALTVDALVIAFKNSKPYLLLIERGIDPFKGMWALPGGFVNMDETLENACIRELEEETGIVVGEMKQFKAFDAVNRDPRHRTISVIHYVVLEELTEAIGGDDAKQAKWFLLDQLPSLAFDHRDAIESFKASGLVSFT